MGAQSPSGWHGPTLAPRDRWLDGSSQLQTDGRRQKALNGSVASMQSPGRGNGLVDRTEDHAKNRPEGPMKSTKGVGECPRVLGDGCRYPGMGQLEQQGGQRPGKLRPRDQRAKSLQLIAINGVVRLANAQRTISKPSVTLMSPNCSPKSKFRPWLCTGAAMSDSPSRRAAAWPPESPAPALSRSKAGIIFRWNTSLPPGSFLARRRRERNERRSHPGRRRGGLFPLTGLDADRAG